MIKAYRKFNEILTLEKAYQKDGRNLLAEDLSILKNGSIIFDENEILWIGEDKDFPANFKVGEEKTFQGHSLTPEVVDSHTHLIFGGDRANEYSRRINGEDYTVIAQQGGGILSTMKGTRSSSVDELYELSKSRILDIHSYGVGTIEIKSGYGLDFDTEYKISHVINKLKKELAPKIQIVNTFMAAHAIPPEYNSGKTYLEQVVFPLMEKLQSENIIDIVDIFHEEGYFNYEETELFFKKATELNLPCKSHADEFNDNKGAILASQYNALSTDHLLCTGEDGIKSLANSKTVATLLPGTGLFLGKPQANATNFLNSGVKVSLASDYNPGSCHCDNILLIASISAPLLKMNMAQVWSAITLNASHSLGLNEQGVLIKGKKPRLSIFKTPSVDYITYNWGKNFSIN